MGGEACFLFLESRKNIMEHPIFTTIELKGTLYLYSVDGEAQRKGFTI
ncbi:hypothetical protein LMG8520_2060 [Lactococcus lactis subsp. lactis]|jgi:hypothetical protein|uniref:Uncharacterized protein n=2 Tax=Lactococcus lactis TaxID=1358 RepID=A0A2A5S6S1_LACLH|nr:hypothetical protein Llab_2093 [Lactococcus lactis]KST81802.1 hypothetical protein LK337_2288 [Lactococcus lactis subsp. lactis]KSU06593.1 hypothetical protein LMG8520_2060 [Lactococcus lactis subsp. lactis]PCS09158.1 hypothetical protein RU90_GL002308 [Lactococcus lactis subsp. hordniae]